MPDDNTKEKTTQTTPSAVNPLGDLAQNPWVILLIALLGGGGGTTLLQSVVGGPQIDTSKFATVEDVQRLEKKVDRLDTKLETASGKMTELRVLIATLTTQPPP